MPIVVRCERCGKRYQVADQLAGRSLACQGCGAALTIPAAGDGSLDLGGSGGSSALDELLGPPPSAPNPFAGRPSQAPARAPQAPLGGPRPGPAHAAPAYGGPSGAPAYGGPPAPGPIVGRPGPPAPYGAPPPGFGAPAGFPNLPGQSLPGVGAPASSGQLPPYAYAAIAGGVLLFGLVVFIALSGSSEDDAVGGNRPTAEATSSNTATRVAARSTSGSRSASTADSPSTQTGGTGEATPEGSQAAPAAEPHAPKPRNPRTYRPGPVRSAKLPAPIDGIEIGPDPAQPVVMRTRGPATARIGQTASFGDAKAPPEPDPTLPEKPTVEVWKLEAEEPTPWKFKDKWAPALQVEDSWLTPVMAHQNRPFVLFSSTSSHKPEEVWDLVRMERVAFIKKAAPLLKPGIVSPSGKRIAAALGTIRKANDPNNPPPTQPTGQPGVPTGPVAPPNDWQLVVAEAKFTGAALAKFPNPEGAIPVCFAGDEYVLARQDDALLIIDVRKKIVSRRLNGDFPTSPTEYVVTPGGRYVLYMKEGKLTAIEPSDGQIVGRISCRYFTPWDTSGMAMSWDGRKLVVWYNVTELVVFDLLTGQTQQELSIPMLSAYGTWPPHRGYETRQKWHWGGDSSPPPQISWLGDDSAWMLDGGLAVVDPVSAAIVFEQEKPFGSREELYSLLPNNYVFGKSEGQVLAVKLPMKEIAANIAVARDPDGEQVAKADAQAEAKKGETKDDDKEDKASKDDQADKEAERQRARDRAAEEEEFFGGGGFGGGMDGSRSGRVGGLGSGFGGGFGGGESQAGVARRPSRAGQAQAPTRRPSGPRKLNSVAKGTNEPVKYAPKYDLGVLSGWQAPLDPRPTGPTLAPICRVEVKPKYVRDSAFSAAGVLALCCGPEESFNETAGRWLERADLKTGQSLGAIDLPDGARLLSVSPDGVRTAVAADFDHGLLNIYDGNREQPLYSFVPFPPPRTGLRGKERGDGWGSGRFARESQTSILWAGFVDSDHLFLLGGEKGRDFSDATRRLVLWRLSEKKPIYETRAISSVPPTFTPGGKHLLVFQTDAIHVLDPLAGKSLGRISTFIDEFGSQAPAAVHESGQRLALSDGSVIRFWNLGTGGWVGETYLLNAYATNCRWADRTHLLLNDEWLYDVERTAIVWAYTKDKAARVLPGQSLDSRVWTIETVPGGKSAVTARTMPGDAVYDRVERDVALDAPRIFGAGSKVRIQTELNGPHSDIATTGLNKIVSDLGLVQSGDADAFTLKASARQTSTRPVRLTEATRFGMPSFFGRPDDIIRDMPRISWEVMLLDPKGKVLWRTGGVADESYTGSIKREEVDQFFLTPWKNAASYIASARPPREIYPQPTIPSTDRPGLGESVVVAE